MLTACSLQEGGGYTLNGGPVDALISYAASCTKSGEPVSALVRLCRNLFIQECMGPLDLTVRGFQVE